MTARERKIRQLHARIARRDAEQRADCVELTRLEIEESHDRGFFISPLRGMRLLAEMDRESVKAA